MSKAYDHIQEAASAGRVAHICVDVQQMFLTDTPWAAPWARRVFPAIRSVVAAFPDRTLFTRFLPPERWEDDTGAWRTYFRHWSNMTRERLEPEYYEVDAELVGLAPGAPVLGRARYSPWGHTEIGEILRKWRAEAVVVTGCETDVCVLATVVGAIDHGFFVAVAEDAVCGSVDETHDAMLNVFRNRYSEHVVVAPVSDIAELAQKQSG